MTSHPVAIRRVPDRLTGSIAAPFGFWLEPDVAAGRRARAQPARHRVRTGAAEAGYRAASTSATFSAAAPGSSVSPSLSPQDQW